MLGTMFLLLKHNLNIKLCKYKSHNKVSSHSLYPALLGLAEAVFISANHLKLPRKFPNWDEWKTTTNCWTFDLVNTDHNIAGREYIGR